MLTLSLPGDSTFEYVNEILWFDHSNESSLPELKHGAICCPKFYKMKFGNLVEICLWLDLAVKGLKINDTVDTKGGTLKVHVHVRCIIIINIININYYNYYHYKGYFPASAIGVECV